MANNACLNDSPTVTLNVVSSKLQADLVLATTAPTTKYLRGDGTWQTITVPNYAGATASIVGVPGLVPSALTTQTGSFLRGDGTWATAPGGNWAISDGTTQASVGAGDIVRVDTVGALSATVVAGSPEVLTLTTSDLVGATDSTAGTAGVTPAPAAGQHRSFLKGDGTWEPVSVLDTLRQRPYAFTHFTLGSPQASNFDSIFTNVVAGTGAGTGQIGSLVGRPGVISATTGTTATGRACAYSGTLLALTGGGGVHNFHSAIRIPTLSNGTDRFQLLIGFFDTPAAIAQTDGAYLLYDEGGITAGSTATGNWQMVTASAATRTISASTTAVAAATWLPVQVQINAAASSVSFTVGGTALGSITTNIPSGPGREFAFGVYIQKSVGTAARNVECDYLGWEQILTTPA